MRRQGEVSSVWKNDHLYGRRLLFRRIKITQDADNRVLHAVKRLLMRKIVYFNETNSYTTRNYLPDLTAMPEKTCNR